MREKKENTHVVKPPSADPRAAGERRGDMGQEGRVVAWAEGQQSPAGAWREQENKARGDEASSGADGASLLRRDRALPRGPGTVCPAVLPWAVRSPSLCVHSLAAALSSVHPLLPRTLRTRAKALVNTDHATEPSSPNGDRSRCWRGARSGCEQLVG